MLGYVSICAEEGPLGALPSDNKKALFRRAVCGAVWTEQLLCWLASSALLFVVFSPCLNIRPFSFTHLKAIYLGPSKKRCPL